MHTLFCYFVFLYKLLTSLETSDVLIYFLMKKLGPVLILQNPKQKKNKNNNPIMVVNKFPYITTFNIPTLIVM